METESKELAQILNQHLHWHKARITCFVGMLLSMIKVRTINLVELSGGFQSPATLESRYKRIKRFFSGFTIDFSHLAKWMLHLFDLDNTPLHISIDRTNWQWGKADINIFMLSIVYKGIALPLLWTLLDKCGNSNTQERIVLIEKFIQQFGKERIASILADREFVGKEWFAWLKEQSIPFCIRIKKNVLTTTQGGVQTSVKALFQDLKIGEERVLSGERTVWEQKVCLSALRLSDGELLIVATDKLSEHPIQHYGRRWEIETLFGCFKSKGFNFEDTHIIKPERISKLIALLAVAFAWAHKVGEWRHEKKPIKIKKHGRRAQGLFRYGLDYLRDAVLNLTGETKQKIMEMMALLRWRSG